MKPIIKVENLGKQYRIGAQQASYATLRESISNVARAPFNWLRRNGDASDNTIWALKDVSFEVMPGEILGIIGRNGAGKSTLLKILSRITEPTTGKADLYGRVGSLLEVGTGFHGELSGRENIYLNGAILGMKRADIDRKFDEIVDFAEIEKFIDTPVKHYSSGMHMRLAFSVAAHLEPEIMLVDEVLAVGDAAFQEKCLGKMGSVARQGRTILFVSHNMPAVLGLCQEAILLNDGKVHLRGPVREIIETYLDSASESAEIRWQLDEAPGTTIAKLKSVRILDFDNKVSSDHQISKPITMEMEFWCLTPGIRLNVSFLVYNSIDVCVMAAPDFSRVDNPARNLYQPGLYRASAVIPGGLLNDGTYRITAVLLRDYTQWVASQEKAISFQVHDDGYGRGDYTSSWIGVIRPILKWTLTCLE